MSQSLTLESSGLEKSNVSMSLLTSCNTSLHLILEKVLHWSHNSNILTASLPPTTHHESREVSYNKLTLGKSLLPPTPKTQLCYSWARETRRMPQTAAQWIQEHAIYLDDLLAAGAPHAHRSGPGCFSRPAAQVSTSPDAWWSRRSPSRRPRRWDDGECRASECNSHRRLLSAATVAHRSLRTLTPPPERIQKVRVPHPRGFRSAFGRDSEPIQSSLSISATAAAPAAASPPPRQPARQLALSGSAACAAPPPPPPTFSNIIGHILKDWRRRWRNKDGPRWGHTIGQRVWTE